jgi:hypothetical protein
VAKVGFDTFHGGEENLDAVLYGERGDQAFKQVFDAEKKKGSYETWLKLAALFGNVVTRSKNGVRGLLSKQTAKTLGLPGERRWLVARRPAVSMIFLAEIVRRMMLERYAKTLEGFGAYNVGQVVVDLSTTFHPGDPSIDDLIKAATGKGAALTVTVPWGTKVWDNAPFRKIAHIWANDRSVTRREAWDLAHGDRTQWLLGQPSQLQTEYEGIQKSLGISKEGSARTVPADLTMQYYDLYKYGLQHRNEDWIESIRRGKDELRKIEVPHFIRRVSAMFERHASFPRLMCDLAAHLRDDELGPPQAMRADGYDYSAENRTRMLERFLEAAHAFEYPWWKLVFANGVTTADYGKGHGKGKRGKPGALAPFVDGVFPPGKERGSLFTSFFGLHGREIVWSLCREKESRAAFASLCRNVNAFCGDVLGMKKVRTHDLHLTLDLKTQRLRLRATEAREEEEKRREEEERAEAREQDKEAAGESAEFVARVLEERAGEAERMDGFKLVTELMAKPLEAKERSEDALDVPGKLPQVARGGEKEARKFLEEEEEEEHAIYSGHESSTKHVATCLKLVAATFELVQALREFDEKAKKEGKVKALLEVGDKLFTATEQSAEALLILAHHAPKLAKLLKLEPEKFEKFLGHVDRLHRVAGSAGDVLEMAVYVYDGIRLFQEGSEQLESKDADVRDSGQLKQKEGALVAYGGFVGVTAMACFGTLGLEAFLAASGPIGLLVAIPVLLIKSYYDAEIEKTKSGCETLAELTNGVNRPAFENLFALDALWVDVATAFQLGPRSGVQQPPPRRRAA